MGDVRSDDNDDAQFVVYGFLSNEFCNWIDRKEGYY